MSVLIKGMEMPTSCCGCFISDEDCELWKQLLVTDLDKVRHKCCPLVPVPPHGDLIDRDEMFEEFVIEGQKSTRYKIGEKWELNGEEIRRVIAKLPSVIPADNPKEET